VLSLSESEAEASFCEDLRSGGDIAARKERFLDVAALWPDPARYLGQPCPENFSLIQLVAPAFETRSTAKQLKLFSVV
jgi:hypothetical protein